MLSQCNAIFMRLSLLAVSVSHTLVKDVAAYILWYWLAAPRDCRFLEVHLGSLRNGHLVAEVVYQEYFDGWHDVHVIHCWHNVF